jgi:hypothetical protein
VKDASGAVGCEEMARGHACRTPSP